MEVKVASYILCLFVSTFPTQKTRFEESKYKMPIWLGIKCNFLEKVAFWVCEENAQCHKQARRCILEKARAPITKLPFNRLCPFLFSLIFLLLCYRPTPVKKVSTKYKHSTTQLSSVYHHNPFQHLIIQTQNQ